MKQNAYFSLLTHTKQLLLVTFCDTLAGIEVSFWADGTERTDGTGRTDGWTDRRGSRNNYLDIIILTIYFLFFPINKHKTPFIGLLSILGEGRKLGKLTLAPIIHLIDIVC